MITTILFQSCQTADARPRGVRLAARALFAVLAMTPLAALAQNVLEAVTFNPGPGGQVDIVLQLSEPAVAPKLFTTDSPPRIAIDFDNTRNGLAERRLEVGVGAASAISAIEAAGRTRVVVELMRPTAYTTRSEGNKLILSVGTGGAAAATQTATGNDPSKAVAGRAEVSNIDFRRGANGEGRLIISFSNDGVAADLRREGTKVVVELRNVALPPQFAQRLDVTDFATPVETIETRSLPNGARMEIRPNGEFESLAYQTGAEYVVEIAPKRQESEAEKRLKEPEYTGERVTFNFQDIPVRSVLQLIADVSQLNVVVADSVSGNVTLRLVNVPWDQALDIILQAKGLDKRRRGDVIWVAPTAEIAAREQALEDARIALEDRAPLVSEYIPINYGIAKDIAELLTSDTLRGQQGGAAGQGGAGATTSRQSSGFLSSRGSVTFDERTNTLLINDTAEKIAEVRQLISLLDRPVDQVLIESRVVVADESFGREIGARFGVTGAYEDRQGNVISTGGSLLATDRMLNQALNNRFGGRTSALPLAVPGIPGGQIIVPRLEERLNVNLPVLSSAGNYALSVLAQDYLLDLELSALSEEGRGEVVSSPRVITANQREATIKQGDEIGYLTTRVQDGVATQQVEFKEALLELKVTPTITQDERVFLALLVKKDEVSGFITSDAGQVPIIAKKEITTAVLVENGQTVVLGGVYEFSSRKDLSKVPLLGDLPALGNLFRTTNTQSQKAELLIFVTPKILEQRRP